MIATLEDYVWCACGQPHQADFSGPEPTLDWTDPADCEAIEPLETNVPMPKDWEGE